MIKLTPFSNDITNEENHSMISVFFIIQFSKVSCIEIKQAFSFTNLHRMTLIKDLLFRLSVIIAVKYAHPLSLEPNQMPDAETATKTRLKYLMHKPQDKNKLNNSYSDAVESMTSKKCELYVTKESTVMFSTDVLKHKYNFVHLELQFQNVTVGEDDPVILYNRWIWTYKGEKGGHQYLFLPNDYGYLSLGLLRYYTPAKPMSINITTTEASQCGNLIVGKNADKKIGDALGKMTTQIASQDDIYNSSYWCYMRRLRIQSDFIYNLCKNSVCTMQTMEYTCCRYVVDYLSKERKVNCSTKQHYHFGLVWWLLPIIFGNVMFAYYPLLLTAFVCRLTMSSRRKKKLSERMEDAANGLEEGEKNLIKLSKHSSPVTFSSTICGPLSQCIRDGSWFSRLTRIMIFSIPLIITIFRVFLDYQYADDLVKAAVSRGALLGFSTMLAGYKMATQYYLHYFGGPFVALPMLFIVGCLLIVVPSNLENVFEAGLIEFDGKSSFLVTMSIESKGRLAGVQMANATGYKRIEKTLLSQVLMLLNCKFWRQTFKLFTTRFSRKMIPMLKILMPKRCLVVLVGFPLLLLYIGFCAVELIFSCIYFAFPVISCFFIFLKAYVKATREPFLSLTGFKRLIGNILTGMVTFSYIYAWYLYCQVFFDAFWYLTKIIMFTYTGVIAFPKLSYGYLILTFMVIYYIFESFKNFQKTYRDLLYTSVKACQHVVQNLGHEQDDISFIPHNGLPVDLWNIIVDRHCPKRTQVARTLFHVFAIVLILGISIELLFRFDKFHDLSLISHVFTVLGICALPKVVKSMCINALSYRQRKKMHRKIQATIREYIDNEIDNAEPDVFDFHYSNEYEDLTV